ncbi:MAG: ABC transporter ATP-binding protein [Rothia sp. (in: high G+C Gram-positive bacteria)]|nr:ABC transporter ATP-binding protein [Rothia sp. (in: high G+C Gram-positive bacteria)]
MARRIQKKALGRTLQLLGPDLKPQKTLAAGGTLALLFEVAFRVLEPWPLKILIDALSVSLGADQGGQAASWSLLLWCGLALILIVALRALCNYLATLAFALVGSRASTLLRARVFTHVQGLSQGFHARNRTADTVQRIVGDVARLQEVAVTAGLPLIANLLTLAVMLVVMLVIDPVLSLVVVLALLVFPLISGGTARKITQASRRTRKAEGQLANTAQESLSSIKVVQAYGLEEHIGRRFTQANKKSLKDGVKARRLSARLERGTDVIVGIATAAVMVGGAWRVLEQQMTIGDLVLFTTYLKTTMKPLRDMAKYTGRIAKAAASGERVADLMDIRNDLPLAQSPQPMGKVAGSLSFKDVYTDYEGHPVLRGLNLEVAPGEFLAVIGPSGAGKSTLVSLLGRSQDPSWGAVLIDQQSVTDLDLSELRSNVSILHQEAVLFTASIRDNIRYGRFEASDQEVQAAAVAAHADPFIQGLPDGYDTQLGERGGTLSGGQRQRIAIARALLRDTPIVVLDEATTGLDPTSAELVMDAIEKLVAGKTTLAVTHDTEVALRADRVVWLQEGKVQFSGSPAELLKTNKVFRAWVSAGSQDQSEVRVEGDHA